MPVSVSLRVYTGIGAVTESAAQSGLIFCAADALSGPPVQRGTNSYERWVRLAIDDPDDSILTTFSFRGSPDLPDGVTIKYGTTLIPKTPVNTESMIATHTLNSERVIWDVGAYSESGERTAAYLVFQEQVAASANSGNIDQNAIAFSWQET